MDIDNYEPPNVLFLRGCFLDDCNSVEDLFDEKLMNEGIPECEFYEIKDTQYNKIPQTFESLDVWPKKTNLKCWMCDCSFQNIPIFIPLTIDKNNHMDTLGNFCAWGCAARYIDLYFDFDERWEKHALLRVLYHLFTGNLINEIVSAHPKTEMVQYGGKKTVKEYREHLTCLNEEYATAIQHNSVN